MYSEMLDRSSNLTETYKRPTPVQTVEQPPHGSSRVLRDAFITSLSRFWKLSIHISGFLEELTRSQQRCAWRPLLNMIYREGHTFWNIIQRPWGREEAPWWAASTHPPAVSAPPVVHPEAFPLPSLFISDKEFPAHCQSLFIRNTAQNTGSDIVCFQNGTMTGTKTQSMVQIYFRLRSHELGRKFILLSFSKWAYVLILKKPLKCLTFSIFGP